MAIILDGKKLASKIYAELSEKINPLLKKPKLAVILAGNDSASMIYVNNKQKTAKNLGIDSIVITLPENATEENILEHIYILNEDPAINAILVQLPLPSHINTKRIINAIDPLKDVDGFHPVNAGKLFTGQIPYAYPCTPKGIMRLLSEYDINPQGRHAVVIGRSNIVGKPAAQMLLQADATVTVAHSKTADLKNLCKTADIILSAVGIPHLVTADMVKENSVIIDVGMNRLNNKLCGDVDFENVKEKASYITPVPGGVGPMTIAMLMENTLELYKIQNQ